MVLKVFHFDSNLYINRILKFFSVYNRYFDAKSLFRPSFEAVEWLLNLEIIKVYNFSEGFSKLRDIRGLMHIFSWNANFVQSLEKNICDRFQVSHCLLMSSKEKLKPKLSTRTFLDKDLQLIVRPHADYYDVIFGIACNNFFHQKQKLISYNSVIALLMVAVRSTATKKCYQDEVQDLEIWT